MRKWSVLSSWFMTSCSKTSIIASLSALTMVSRGTPAIVFWPTNAQRRPTPRPDVAIGRQAGTGNDSLPASLEQSPNFSWDPGYFLYILIGFGTLAAALHGLFYYGEKVDKKSDTKTNSKETYPF